MKKRTLIFVITSLLMSCTHITQSEANSRSQIMSDKLNKLNHHFYGTFSFEMSGLNPLTGDGPYQVHTVEISKDSCKVDIVGYQADRHFSCYTNSLSADAIEVYQSDNNNKYGTIHKDNNTLIIELGSDKNKYMMETVKE